MANGLAMRLTNGQDVNDQDTDRAGVIPPRINNGLAHLIKQLVAVTTAHDLFLMTLTHHKRTETS